MRRAYASDFSRKLEAPSLRSIWICDTIANARLVYKYRWYRLAIILRTTFPRTLIVQSFHHQHVFTSACDPRAARSCHRRRPRSHSSRCARRGLAGSAQPCGRGSLEDGARARRRHHPSYAPSWAPRLLAGHVGVVARRAVPGAGSRAPRRVARATWSP